MELQTILILVISIISVLLIISAVFNIKKKDYIDPSSLDSLIDPSSCTDTSIICKPPNFVNPATFRSDWVNPTQLPTYCADNANQSKCKPPSFVNPDTFRSDWVNPTQLPTYCGETANQTKCKPPDYNRNKYFIQSSIGIVGIISIDGKQIKWSDGGIYNRLVPVGSDPTLLDTGVFITTGLPSYYPDNKVNWSNGGVELKIVVNGTTNTNGERKYIAYTPFGIFDLTVNPWVDSTTLSTYCAANPDKCKPSNFENPATYRSNWVNPSTTCTSTSTICKPTYFANPTISTLILNTENNSGLYGIVSSAVDYIYWSNGIVYQNMLNVTSPNQSLSGTTTSGGNSIINTLSNSNSLLRINWKNLNDNTGVYIIRSSSQTTPGGITYFVSPGGFFFTASQLFSR